MTQLENKKLDYTRHYQKWHSDKPEHIDSMKHLYNRMLENYLPDNKDISILDVGCGMGFAMLALKHFGYSAIEGIDIDKEQVRSCQNKGLSVSLVEDSISYLSQRQNQYDLILALDVIEHIPYVTQLDFIHAVSASLRQNGQFICTVPNASSGLASRWRYIDWTHHISFTEHSLDFLLFNAGFKDIHVYPTEFFVSPKFNLMGRCLITKSYLKSIVHWKLFQLVRTFRRIEMIAELGWEQGKEIPLSLNILSTAVKS